jgi:hypothetical protein
VESAAQTLHPLTQRRHRRRPIASRDVAEHHHVERIELAVGRRDFGWGRTATSNPDFERAGEIARARRTPSTHRTFDFGSATSRARVYCSREGVACGRDGCLKDVEPRCREHRADADVGHSLSDRDGTRSDHRAVRPHLDENGCVALAAHADGRDERRAGRDAIRQIQSIDPCVAKYPGGSGSTDTDPCARETHHGRIGLLPSAVRR